MLAVDQPAPALVLPDIRGGEVSLADLRGQVVLVRFFRFADCPVCNLHLAELVQRQDEIDAAGATLLTVFHSPLAALRDAMQRHAPQFGVLADSERVAYRAWGVEQGLHAVSHPAFHIKAMAAMAHGWFGNPLAHGGALGLPADFVVGRDGVLRLSHHGRHGADSLPLDTLLDTARRAAAVRAAS